MKVELNLTKLEVEAILRANLSRGHGVVRPVSLLSAEFKLREGCLAALREREEANGAGR
jgi:hypothetical protein